MGSPTTKSIIHIGHLCVCVCEYVSVCVNEPDQKESSRLYKTTHCTGWSPAWAVKGSISLCSCLSHVLN